MRKIALFVIAAGATGLVAGVMIVGCGGGDGDSSSQDVTVPELKPPPGDLKGTTDEGTTGDQGTTDDGSSTTTPATPDSTGGAQAPSTGGSGSNQSGGADTPDTQQQDTPPPQGSPAERFEQFCNDNPGAC